MKQRINHPETTSPSPHISGAVACGEWVFLSGQGPIDITTKQPVPGTIEEETLRTLENIDALLKAAGCTREDVVKCTCYLADLADFPGFNTTYRDFFSQATPPARTTVGAPLLAGIRIEIDVVAHAEKTAPK